MAKREKVKIRHKFYFPIVKFLSFLFSRVHLGYRSKSKYKIKKGESILILANHQTDFDPFCIITSFNRPIYTVATDSIVASKMGKFMESELGVIPKKKGASDIRTTVKMRTVIKEGGSLLLFPEGNRTYANFQYFVNPSIIKMIKNFKVTLVLFYLSGGTGVFPRFASKKRKGPFKGTIKMVLKYEEYKDMPDEELFKIIMDTLRSYDSETGFEYKSKARAEYLERMFFYCPKCHSFGTLKSDKNRFYCQNCDLDLEYTTKLNFAGNYAITPLEWWNLDKKAILDSGVEDVSFSDQNVVLKQLIPYHKKQLLFSGEMKIDNKNLYFGDFVVELKDIELASVVGGKKLLFSADGKDYMVVGDDRFNPLKYVFLFNKLDTKMKENKSDEYFGLGSD